MNKDALPYRPCAGIMLLNHEGRVFVGQRIDTRYDAWQMPQGGVDEGEEAEAAAVRELGEETGIAPHHFSIVARASRTLLYDLPDDMIGRMWGGRYRGQEQHWFLARFTGTDDDIDIATEHPEFRAWEWADVATLVERIVPFKQELYANVIAEFSAHL